MASRREREELELPDNMEFSRTVEVMNQPLGRGTRTTFLGRIIRTTVTSSPMIIERWIGVNVRYYRHLLGRRLIFGLGVQWTPGSNSADTLQLCLGQYCLLIQLNHAPFLPRMLRHLLADPEHVFVGIWNRYDAIHLWDHAHELWVRNWIDIGDYVDTSDGNWRPTVENLAWVFLGCDGVRNGEVERTDWSVSRLTMLQIHYAVIDAYVAFRIGRRVLQSLGMGYHSCPHCRYPWAAHQH